MLANVAIETPPVWRLVVLGTAQLEYGTRIHLLERKTAAVLTYLGLEGQASGETFAGYAQAFQGT